MSLVPSRYVLVPGLLLWAGAAWAAQPHGEASAPASPKHASTAPVTQSQVARVQRRVAHSSAQLNQLQKKVAAQEAQSQQSEAKLQQQDQDIAKLKQQLQLLHAGAGSP